MSNRLHSDSSPFPHFFVCLQGTYQPQMCGFLSVWRFLVFFVCPWTVYKMHGFLLPGPWPPFSLLSNLGPNPTANSSIRMPQVFPTKKCPPSCTNTSRVSMSNPDKIVKIVFKISKSSLRSDFCDQHYYTPDLTLLSPRLPSFIKILPIFADYSNSFIQIAVPLAVRSCGSPHPTHKFLQNYAAPLPKNSAAPAQ